MNLWYTKDSPQLPSGRWVLCVAHIRNNATGEVRASDEVAIIEPGDRYPSPYIWSEGNYSCDCNRELIFERAAGKEPADDSTPCTDGRFSVNLENPATGEIYYREYS